MIYFLLILTYLIEFQPRNTKEREFLSFTSILCFVSFYLVSIFLSIMKLFELSEDYFPFTTDRLFLEFQLLLVALPHRRFSENKIFKNYYFSTLKTSYTSL